MEFPRDFMSSLKRRKSKQSFGKNGWAVQQKSKYPPLEAPKASQLFKFPQKQDFGTHLHESKEFKQTRKPHNTTFQNLVEIAANRFGMGKQLGSIRICHEARKILANHFPSATSDQIQVLSFKAGLLLISSQTSTWAHQLTMKKHQILTELNQKLGEDIIKRINLRTSSPSNSDYEQIT